MQTLGVPDVIDVTEMKETMESGGYAEYATRIRGLIYALWAGHMESGSFYNGMEDLLEFGLRKAWREGMAQVGMTWDDRTPEEQVALAEIVFEQLQHVSGLADYIIAHNKASGNLLRDTDYRSEMWANAYQQAYNKALQMASNDPKLMWILGKTILHCVDCLKYSGKVKRASYWQKINAAPQSPLLACKGINCKCRLEIVTNEPLSRGYLTPPSGA